MSAAGPVRLLGAGDVRAIAARLGVQPTKRLGQNFVVQPGTVRQIAALAAPFAPGDVILEVGPGLGSLTLALLEAAAPVPGARVVAVEVDPVLAAELPKTIAERAPGLAERVDVIHADALKLGLAPSAAVRPAQAAGATGTPGSGGSAGLACTPQVTVANLPYNVAVPVVLHLLAVFPSLLRAVVMVQAEVADRMCAGPGSRVYGVPSAKLAWYGQARLAGTVPRSVFWPVPNVDSKLVAFTRHQLAGRIPGATAAGLASRGAVTRGAVFAVIDAAFGQRRKTLRAALATWAGSPAEAERVLRAAGVSPGERGESLGIAEFAKIAAARGASGGSSEVTRSGQAQSGGTIH